MTQDLTKELDDTFAKIETDIEAAQELGTKIRTLKNQAAKAEAKHAERLKATSDRLALMLANGNGKSENLAEAIKVEGSDGKE